MSILTIDDVRRASGAPSTIVSDDQIVDIIEEVESESEKYLNTKFEPTEEIDIVDGTGTDRVMTMHNPLLSVRAIKSDSNTITPAYVHIHPESGLIVLGDNSEESSFIQKKNSLVIKYIYGFVRPSYIKTATTAASIAGTSIALSVSEEEGFKINEWVEIKGMDGHKEAAKVTVIAASSITVDRLIYTHESGSTVSKLEIPLFIKRFILVEAAIACALKAIGTVYTLTKAYSIGEFSVTKSEPFLNWKENLEKNLNEREMRRNAIKPRFSILA